MATTKALHKRQHLIDRSLLGLVALVLLLLGARVGAAPCDRIDATALVFRATALVFRDTGSEKAMLRSHAKASLVVVIKVRVRGRA